jgi:hypothetical protein
MRLWNALVKRWKKFLWSAPFWALIGLVGCGSGPNAWRAMDWDCGFSG